MSVTKVIFVCHGNICRSTMAEFIFRKMAEDEGQCGDYEVSSAGVSSEEEGNDIYPPAKSALRKHGIPFSRHFAHRITDSEFLNNDLVVALDSSNMRRLVSRFGSCDKLVMLLDRDVEDPWYTGDFETAYRDITEGCRNLFVRLESK